MPRKLTRLWLLIPVTLLLTSCAAPPPPPPEANLCASVHPIYLDPSETTAITTSHLMELVGQNRKIKEFCP